MKIVDDHKDEVKLFGKFILGSILVIVIIILSIKYIPTIIPKSYDNYDNNDITDDFLKFYNNNSVFYTSQNTEIYVSSIGGIGKDNSNPSNIVMLISIGNDSIVEKQKKWTKMTTQKKKQDLKECADLFIDYAKQNDYVGNYNLYVAIDEGLSLDMGNYVYNYTKDSIWIPNHEKDFLNGKKVPDYERGYRVYIKDGKFKEIGKNSSAMY